MRTINRAQAQRIYGFGSDTGGNIAMMSGLVALPFMTMLALAVDVNYASNHRHTVQASLDSALLAAARKGIEGGATEAAGCRIKMTHAQHSAMIQDGDQIVYGGEPAGFVVRVPDGRAFYHAGDTNLFSDMQLIQRLWKPELAMLPIGDLYTMDPEQGAIACDFLGAKTVLPMHYGTFPPLTGTPDALREHIAKLGLSTEVVAPEPGEIFAW